MTNQQMFVMAFVQQLQLLVVRLHTSTAAHQPRKHHRKSMQNDVYVVYITAILTNYFHASVLIEILKDHLTVATGSNHVGF